MSPRPWPTPTRSSCRAWGTSPLWEFLTAWVCGIPCRRMLMGKPLLGICLGMQWLFDGSEEAPQIAGTGLFFGTCRQFPSSVKSPHVGWNSLKVQRDSRLLRGLVQDTFVYYTHSFHAPVVAATTAASAYGLPFSAAVEQDNIFGVQFHPEKSGPAGLLILKNFCEVR